ncbi:MAG: arylsulfatase, partial [Thermomicrobiales bacterium]
MVQQQYFYDTAPAYGTPHLVNLLADPKEREPIDYPYLHSWVGVHVGKIIGAFQESVKRAPLL